MRAIKEDSIPLSGFLFENTVKKEEENNRQLDAIRKVDKNEVQNPDLIYFLFKPDELPPGSTEYSNELIVKQKGSNKKPLVYSANQERAIQNALNRSPLSIIQGHLVQGKPL